MRKLFLMSVSLNAKSTKAVIIGVSGENGSLVSCHDIPHSRPIPTDALLSPNDAFNYQDTVKKLQTLKGTLPQAINHVAINVPDNTIISKVLSIDSQLHNAERLFAIEQALSAASPTPIEDLSIDFVEMEQKQAANYSTTPYYVVATYRALIDERVKAFRDKGFTPVLVEGESHSFLQICRLASQRQTSNQPCFLLYIDETYATLCGAYLSDVNFYKRWVLDVPHNDICNDDVALDQLCQKVANQIQIVIKPSDSAPTLWVSGYLKACSSEGFMEELRSRIKLKITLLISALDIRELLPCEVSLDGVDLEKYIQEIGLAVSGLNWLKK